MGKYCYKTYGTALKYCLVCHTVLELNAAMYIPTRPMMYLMYENAKIDDPWSVIYKGNLYR